MIVTEKLNALSEGLYYYSKTLIIGPLGLKKIGLNSGVSLYRFETQNKTRKLMCE